MPPRSTRQSTRASSRRQRKTAEEAFKEEPSPDIESSGDNEDDQDETAVDLVKHLPDESDGPPDDASEQTEQPEETRAQFSTLTKFIVLAATNFTVSSLAYAVLDHWGDRQLLAVSTTLDSKLEIGLLATWQIVQLAVAWFAGFDSFDIASLGLLSHVPVLYLLHTFYSIHPATLLATLAIDLGSAVIPVQFLRPLSAAHSNAESFPGRDVVVDFQVKAYTAVLSATIFSVALLTSYQTFLPRVLVLHFDGLASVTPAYSASYWSVLPITAALGVAARTFLFAPVASTGDAPEDERLREFDPAEASLLETFVYNIWGYTRRAKVSIGRTSIASLLVGINVYLQCSLTIRGVDNFGAAIYAAVWALSTAFAGFALGFVGRP